MTLKIIDQEPAALKASRRHARTHSAAQVRQLAKSIKTFSFIEPVIVDADNEIIVGHGRVEGAKLAGLDRVPTVRLDHLTPEQVRAYRIASNRLDVWSRRLMVRV